MKRIFLFFILALCVSAAVGQSRYYMRYDTVYIERGGSNGELVIRNGSRDSTGGLFTNVRGGHGVYKKTRLIGDSLFIGIDTFHIGRIDTAVNIGNGAGVFAGRSGNSLLFKSLAGGYGINYALQGDSIVAEADTSEVVTPFDLTTLVSTSTYWQLNGSNNLVPKSFPGTTVEITGKHLRVVDSGLVVIGVSGGLHPSEGPGMKMFWHPGKAAFRTGLALAGAFNNSVIGDYSFAGGVDALAIGANSFAYGNGPIAIGIESVALGGGGTTAGGLQSFATGGGTSASGAQAAAFGNGSSASGGGSFAMGNFTVAFGGQSAAFGNGTQAIGNYSVSFGQESHARAQSGFVSGYVTQTNTTTRIPQFSIGRLNDTIRTAELFRIGWHTTDVGRSNVFTVDTLGRTMIAVLPTGDSEDSVVVWDQADSLLKKVALAAVGTNLWELDGDDNLVPKPFAGSRVIITGKHVEIVDSGLVALGVFGGAHPSPGAGNKMFWHPGKYAFRAGFGDVIHYSDVNIGTASAAFGAEVVASGFASFAAGFSVSASGEGAVALGGAGSTATGDYSFASGVGVVAFGGSSTAFGFDTEANGNQSFAAGNTVGANGNQSAAFNAFNIANGQYSMASGFSTEVNAEAGFTAGKFTTTNNTTRIPQFSIGKSNDTLRGAEVFRVGWSSDDVSNHTIFSVDTLGRIKVAKLDNGNSGDSVVVWHAADSMFKKVAQSDISGGGGGGGGSSAFGIDSLVIGGTASSVLYVGTGSQLQESPNNFSFDSTNNGLTIRRDNLGVTQSNTAGLILRNNQAAAAGTQQISLPVHWIAQGWKTNATAASQTVEFRAYLLPVQGAVNPTASWILESSINGGAYATAFSVSNNGSGNFVGSVSAVGVSSSSNLTAGATAGIIFSGRTIISSSANGLLTIANNAQTDFTRLNFGGNTSAFAAIERSTTKLIAMLGDGSARTHFGVLDEAYDATSWNGNDDVPTKNAVRDQNELIKDKPWSTTHSYTQSTANATPANMIAAFNSIAIDIPNNAVGIIKVHIVANGGSGAATHKLQGVKYYTFNKAGGTLAIDAADVIVADKVGASISTATWQLTSSSNQPVLEVTGVAATNINWAAAVEIILVIN